MTEDAAATVARPISPRREYAIMVVLSLLAVSMIVIASATNSYVPLFFAWLPYIGIPIVVSRIDRSRPAVMPAATTLADSTSEEQQDTGPSTEPREASGDASHDSSDEAPGDRP